MNFSKVFAFDDAMIRVLGTPEKPLFVAADVCRIFGIKNPSDSLDDFDESEKGIAQIYTLGGDQPMLVVTEPGLYRLIFRSDKPEARKFQNWVFSQVLPEIRATGYYGLNQERLWLAFDQARSARVQLMLLETLGIAPSEVRREIAAGATVVLIEPEVIFADILEGLRAGTINGEEYFRVKAPPPDRGVYELWFSPRTLDVLRLQNQEKYREFNRWDFRTSLKLSEDWKPGKLQQCMGPKGRRKIEGTCSSMRENQVHFGMFVILYPPGQ